MRVTPLRSARCMRGEGGAGWQEQGSVMRVSVGGGGQGGLQEQGSMAGLGEGGGGAGWQEQGQASMARVGVGGVNNCKGVGGLLLPEKNNLKNI